MSSPFVAILMGSKSDLEAMQAGAEVLRNFGIRYEIKISSAHRTPEATRQYVENAVERGCQVFIAGAGLAAHLAGAIAAHTTRPVIGVPMEGGPLKGFDALLSTVQMPAGVPVASVAIGKTGARNAAYLASQILALADGDLAERVAADRQASGENVKAQDRALQEQQ